MFKGVIFDLDGTLLDTIEDLGLACNYALNKYSFPIHDIEKYKVLIGGGRRKLMESILPESNRDERTINEVLTLFDIYYTSHMVDKTVPYDGIRKLLVELKRNNIKIGIVSNKPHEYTVKIAKKFFGDMFDMVLGHRKGDSPKPDPKGVIEVINYFNLEREECVYIGDSDIDIITSRNANVKSVGVAWGFRGEGELKGEGADYIVYSAEELRNVLLR